MKGRIINTANHILSNIIVVNESARFNTAGTWYEDPLHELHFDKTGDVKSVTLKTLGVVNEQSLIIPKEFSLSQNYPNPFNPLTRDRIWSSAFIARYAERLDDVIGREVTTLVNGRACGDPRCRVEWKEQHRCSGSQRTVFLHPPVRQIPLQQKIGLVK